MHFARRSRLALLLLSVGFPSLSGIAQPSTAAASPTLLVDVDHRAALDLDGDWHFIVDPYQTGLYNFHHEAKKDGLFQSGSSMQRRRIDAGLLLLK